MTRAIETFGERLKRLRKRAGFATQQDFAERVGVTNVTVCYWERQWRTPQNERLIDLAKVLGVTVHYLLNGEEEPALKALHRAINYGSAHQTLLAMVREQERP